MKDSEWMHAYGSVSWRDWCPSWGGAEETGPRGSPSVCTSYYHPGKRPAYSLRSMLPFPSGESKSFSPALLPSHSSWLSLWPCSSPLTHIISPISSLPPSKQCWIHPYQPLAIVESHQSCSGFSRLASYCLIFSFLWKKHIGPWSVVSYAFEKNEIILYVNTHIPIPINPENKLYSHSSIHT